MAQTLCSTFSLLSLSTPVTSGRNSSQITKTIFFFPPEKKNPPRWRCNASKKPSFIDQILDYIEGGPKLRKWYGAPDFLPKDGAVAEEQDDADIKEARDAVLVTDGDGDIGQMVILSLIVKRTQVKALVKDKRAALEAFGTYVESLAGDANNKVFLKKALRGVRAIICPNEGSQGIWSSLAAALTLDPSAASAGRFFIRSWEPTRSRACCSIIPGADGIQALMTSNARKLAEQDESTLMMSGIPYTIIRVGSLQNTPGGTHGFSFEEGCAARGSLSKEDAAFICVEALESVPETRLIIEVVNGKEKVSDWKQYFAGLMQKQGQVQG